MRRLKTFLPGSEESRAMIFDFDTPDSRRETGCIKYDRKSELGPFWVAGIDFALVPVIQKALLDRVNHGILDYTQLHAGLNETPSAISANAVE
mgnify:CR=1 FL=1